MIVNDKTTEASSHIVAAMKSWWLGLACVVACKANPSKLDQIGGAPAKPKPPELPLSFDAAAIDAWVASQMTERGAVGASLVIIKDGQIALAKGYGHARSDATTPVTADTPMAIGSLTKAFTCALIYGLADEGKLALTDSPAKWYPRATRAADITLADLGGHTSGYRDFYPLDYVDARMLNPIEPDALIAAYAQLPLDFEPRARFSYSNTGFTMLARIAEQVSGKPYQALIDERIFKPLGMSSSLRSPAGAASGHVSFLLDGAEPGPSEAGGWLFGIGDIWASANDLAKWDLAMMEGKVVSAASHAALATARPLANGRSSNYSCGWFIRTAYGEHVLHHNGWVGGFHTRNMIVPRTRSAVVFLTNDEYTNLMLIPEQILGLLTKEDAAPTINGPPAADAARDLVLALQRGTLDRSTLGDDLNAYFDDARVTAAAAKLRDLGPPTVTLVSRGERGGQEVANVEIAFPSKTATATMFRTPDGKIHQLLFDN